MPVPNAITQVINKQGEVVSFNLSKIHRSITSAIRDIENVQAWEAESRAIKYSEQVRDRIYRSFYDLGWLVEDAFLKIKGFEESERSERVARKEFFPRLTTLFYQHFLEAQNIKELESSYHNQLDEYIKERLTSYRVDGDLVDSMSSIFSQKVIEFSQQPMTAEDHFPDREFIQDHVEIVLKEIGEVCVAEGFMIFREGKRKVQKGDLSPAQFTRDGVHRDMLQKTLLWNIDHECDTLFSLNDWVLGKGGKHFRDLVHMSDERFYNDIKTTVDEIMQRHSSTKIVVIAGPSCSNKTTTTAIIAKELEKHHLKLKQLNVDDYFFPLLQHPKDEFGDYDFEMPEALDLDLLSSHLADLIEGKTIQKPIYNFKTGDRDGYEDFGAGEDELVLIDCLHGLYHRVSETVPAEKKYKIYTESMNVLRSSDGSYTKWTDVRLLKRMIRDSLYRSYSTKKTLGHWPYVRKGELKHIIPYIYSANKVLNSGLPYELPILKQALSGKLPNREYIEQLRKDKRLDSYIRGVRTSVLMDTVYAYPELDVVPETSPLREFIGGSVYELAHNE